MQQHIDEYNKNEEGCYIITSKHPVGYLTKLCWNATRHFHQIGRSINHAQNPNALLTQPLHVRGKWRVGFLAARDINVGDEVVWDYRVRGEVWSKCRLVDGVVVGDKDAIVVTFLLPHLLLCNHYKFLCNLSVSRDGHE